ncbi:choice-of-anchor R domain-containing protein [Microcystis aeruginosa]|uniref:choice-of-anchor R domain-containing protein n=1 Tax=Microcystis aeruginosa TaxID=1126 RepID=UPI00352A0CF3
MIGNLPQTNDNIPSGISSSNMVVAIPFDLPAGDNYSLGNVILPLGDYETGDIPLVQIRNDVGGSNPGSTVLANFTNPTPQGAGNFNYTFTPTSPFTFAASTKYWLYVTTTNGAFSWRVNEPSITPTGIATLSPMPVVSGTGETGLQRFSTNGGSTFTSGSMAPNFQINTADIPPSVATPEPGAIAALSLFGLGLLGVKGRRNEG